MKKLLFLIVITFSTASYSQTPITDANFQEAINTCLTANPIDGMCSESEYGPMPNWDVTLVTDMSSAFKDRNTFNGDISNWNTSSVANMRYMFNGASVFNQPLNEWNTSKVENMEGMFFLAYSFNRDISYWDTSNVTNMYYMFYEAPSFNQTLNKWDTSKVELMEGMFSEASSFNADISEWDTSSVNNMGYMFQGALVFNGDISSWDVSSVSYMKGMFISAASFNTDISEWDTSEVTNMDVMFYEATAFNQPLNEWDITSVGIMSNLFDYSGLSTDNYDGILNSWSQQDVQSNVTLGAAEINYCNGAGAKDILTGSPNNWIINDGGLDCASAGVGDQNQLDISIYPNPTSDIVYIDGNYTQLKVAIYNLLCKKVIFKSNTDKINVKELSKGVYIIRISDGIRQTNRKFVKN
tara:strand:- start:118 stop:1350 length:1233 start_codon:yes stop_codon:yes gene_type:complete